MRARGPVASRRTSHDAPAARVAVRRVPARAVALAVALVLCAAGSPAADRAALPDLAGAEPRVRSKIEALHRDVENDASDAQAWGRYGMALDAHRYAEAAAAAYRRAAELAPRDFRWSYYLGALYETTDARGAATWLERAVAIDGAYAPARIRLARTLEALGRRDDALAHYREAARLAPDDPLGHLGAGRITLAAGDATAAIALLERARERGPRIQAVVATLARAYQRAGDTQRAQALAAEARDLPRMMHHHDPRHAAVGAEAVDRESFLRRARTLLETGQAERARAQLEELLRLEPNDAETRLALAGVLDQLGLHEEAFASARRALDLDPSLRGGHATLANALFELGRVAEAEEAARAALAVDPDNARLHLLSSMAAAARGDVDAVTRHLDRAYTLGTSDPELRRVMSSLLQELAGALEDVGRHREAAARLEQVLELAEQERAPEASRAEIRARIERLRARGD
jgi:tetratricopeptide (TPR) repeat protein